MRKVIYLKEIKDIDEHLPEMGASTLIIYSDYYDIKTKYQKIKWSVYKSTYTHYPIDNIVIVGMNRIRTAESRYDMVYSYLYRLNKFATKVVIDDKPFTGEPWRIWYHYGFLHGKWLDVDYSHPLEEEWKKWFYYDKNTCKISGEYLPLFISDTYSELDKLNPKIEFYEPDNIAEEYYSYIKRIMFEKHGTPKMLISSILKECNKHFGCNIGYETYLATEKEKVPNLGVYRFMAEENIRRMNIYNCFSHEALRH